MERNKYSTGLILFPIKLNVSEKLTRFVESTEVVKWSLRLRYTLLGQKPAMTFRKWQHAEQGHQLVATADEGNQSEIIADAVTNSVENRYATGHWNGCAQYKTAPRLGHTDLGCIDSWWRTGQSHTNTYEYSSIK